MRIPSCVSLPSYFPYVFCFSFLNRTVVDFPFGFSIRFSAFKCLLKDCFLSFLTCSAFSPFPFGLDCLLISLTVCILDSLHFTSV